jgi:hypothetical protein
MTTTPTGGAKSTAKAAYTKFRSFSQYHFQFFGVSMFLDSMRFAFGTSGSSLRVPADALAIAK